MLKTILSAAASAPTTSSVFNTEYEFAQVNNHPSQLSFQAVVTGTGAVTATVIFEASNDGTSFVTVSTLSLSGTTSAADGLLFAPHWNIYRCRLTAISGTSAKVTANVGGVDVLCE
jgi:hypothetical protein